MFDYPTAAALIEGVQKKLETMGEITDDLVSSTIKSILVGSPLTINQRQIYFTHVFNAIRKLDILQPLLEDKEVVEIMVNGLEAIFIEKRGELQLLPYRFSDLKQLNTLVQRIVANVNRSVNTSNPIVDARLNDGSRVNIVLPPIALNGPILTIRKFSKDTWTMSDFIQMGTIKQEQADYLIEAVQNSKSIFLSGGTGSGKTTFLNVLTQYLHPELRVITIEDACELDLSHLRNWVRLETRNPNVEGHGEVNMRTLIKTALRMRPDRLIIGEVRGTEAFDMLQAMNTGHEGSLCTGHANSAVDMIYRLQTMVLGAGNLPIEAVERMICSAIDIVIHLVRSEYGLRCVNEIIELKTASNNKVDIITIFKGDFN